MERLQTPVVAGVSGAAVLAALLSFGGGNAQKPVAPQIPSATKQSIGDDVEKGTAPNQEGPWRAVCEEYAPNGVYSAAPTQTHRGYQVARLPSDIPDGAVEVTNKLDAQGRLAKIAVHKQLVGDLVFCIPKPQLSGIHLIIATLPDPDKTEMRLEFDRYVDALEKAAAVRGFHYTGYWFPWSSRETGPVPHKEDEVEAALLRAEQPGILLFHNNQGQRLFIFVVGETPTSGINRMQLVQALRYRQALIAASLDPKVGYDPDPDISSGLQGTVPGRAAAKLAGPLMICGPHFSGALASLVEVLQESSFLKKGAEGHPRPSVEIVSPDAGSPKLIKTFKNYCSSDTGCSFRPLSITATDEDDVASKYLGNLGYERSQVAELVEDESGFGDIEREVGRDVGADTPAPFGLILTFPRELSAVRSLSDQQSEQLAESGARLLSFSKNPVDIKLAGKEPIERDRPSTYASEAEASEISNALEDDVRVLRRNGIQCIVVSATNPLDRIFLLEYIHDQLPNVREVVQEADELEISHPHFVDLTGTIVISSLPTIPELAVVKGGKPSSISFASVAAEEQFLSASILLDDAVMTRDITKSDDDLKDAKLNGDIREDGWRVSIAGENGFELVPLGKNRAAHMSSPDPTLVFGTDDEINGVKSDDGVALEVSEPNRTPRLFIYFSIVIFLLTALHLAMLLNSERPIYWKEILKRLGYGIGDNSLLKFAYVESGGQQGFNRTFNLLAVNNQVFLLNCLVLAVNPVLWPFSEGPQGLHWIMAGSWVMAACMGAAVAVSLKRYWDQISFVSFTSVFFSSLTVCYLLSSVVFLCRWRSDAVAEWRRVLTLDDGLSPVIPIAAVLLAWALWAALQLRRVKWIAHRKVDLLRPEILLQNSFLGGRICQDMKAIQNEIDPPTVGMRTVLFILFFVGVIASCQWSHLRGIEPYCPWGDDIRDTWRLILHILFPPSFEWWFGIWGFVMLLMTVMQTAYQLYRIWKSLARLLRRLEPTRMKCAFERIGKDDRVHIKLWDLGKAQMRFDEIALIIESLRRMRYCSEADSAQESLGAYQNADLEGKQPTQDHRNKLNERLNVCVEEALERLEEKKPTEPQGARGLLQSLFSPNAEPDADQAMELDRYLALRLSTLVRYVLLQMRNLMWFVIYGYFLAVVAVTFYPFQGGRTLSDMLAATFLIVLVIMAMLVTEVLRNPMLKRLEDSESNIASVLEACFHLLSVGGLPALALLGWQFPWIGRLAFSWFRPLLSALR